MVRAAQAVGVEQIADPLLADLEQQVVAEQRRPHGSEVDVGVVQRQPVRRREVIGDRLAQGRGQLQDGLAVVEGPAGEGVAGGRVDVPGGVDRLPRRRPDPVASVRARHFE